MGRIKKKLMILLIPFVLFGFSLKSDTSTPLNPGDKTVVLKSIYSFYKNKDLFKFAFKERVYIPFLEKWQEFKGAGYYEIGNNRFNIQFNNLSKDHYICNGNKIFYNYMQEGKANTRIFEVNKNSLNYLFPDEKKWEIFNKELYSNNKLNYLIILKPLTKDFPIKKVEFSLNKKTLYVQEITIIGNDDRILYFKILQIKKLVFSANKLNKMFSNEK